MYLHSTEIPATGDMIEIPDGYVGQHARPWRTAIIEEVSGSGLYLLCRYAQPTDLGDKEIRVRVTSRGVRFLCRGIA